MMDMAALRNELRRSKDPQAVTIAEIVERTGIPAPIVTLERNLEIHRRLAGVSSR